MRCPKCNWRMGICPGKKIFRCTNPNCNYEMDSNVTIDWGMPEWEQTALDFATEAHKGQVCDSGKGYMEDHILPVVNLLKQITEDKDIITAGYLHDILEDTPITYNELKTKFGICVAELVKEVTNKQVQGVKDYFPNLYSKKAIIIKFADRLQNLSRMEPWSKKRQQRYLDRSKFWKNEKDVVRQMLEYDYNDLLEKAEGWLKSLKELQK